MSYKNIAKAGFLLLLSNTLSADSVLLYKNYLNQSYDSAKNSMMGGATTATAKGYGAILSNPAGLSSNSNVALYAKSVYIQKKDKNSVVIDEMRPETQLSFGLLYDSFALEYKLEDYVALGGAYGYESQYGLFSVGLSYLLEQTNRDAEGVLASDEFATGSYGTFGLMWQKSIVDESHFYTLYLGLSKKSSGQYSGGGNPKIVPLSPERMSYGIGFETNIKSTSLLVTFDMSEESWLSSSETLSSTALGAKWLLASKAGVSAGLNTQTFSGSKLKDINSYSIGVEFGLLNAHMNLSLLQREINDIENQLYLTEQSAHLDVALTF